MSIQYQKDINRLKELKAICQRQDSGRQTESDYIIERERIAKKYSKSIRTIQRDMNKDKIVRKQRSDSGKLRKQLSDKEKQMITEARTAGKTKKEAVRIIEKKTGKKISNRVASRTEPLTPSPLPTCGTGSQKGEGRVTMFGEEAKKFLEQFLEYDLIAPENGIKFKHKNVSFILDKEHCKDIILSLIDAYNKATDETNRLQLDRNKYMRSQIFNLISYQVGIAKISGNILNLERVVRMYQKMEIDYGSLPADLDVLIKVCRAIKPDVTEDEIFSLIKKLSEN